MFHYTKSTYPNTLRQLILINLITVLEVYFTNVVREIATRDLEPFKPDNEKADYMRNHLLNFSTIKGIENDLIEKDIRKLFSNLFIFKCSRHEMLNITSEMIEQHNDKINEIVKIVYDKPHNFLFINVDSQRMFKNWDELIFNDDE